MNFIMGLPLTQRKNNAIWVIEDGLTKTTHFIAMRNTWILDQLGWAYLEEIVRLHGYLALLRLIGTPGFSRVSGRTYRKHLEHCYILVLCSTQLRMG